MARTKTGGPIPGGETKEPFLGRNKRNPLNQNARLRNKSFAIQLAPGGHPRSSSIPSGAKWEKLLMAIWGPGILINAQADFTRDLLGNDEGWLVSPILGM